MSILLAILATLTVQPGADVVYSVVLEGGTVYDVRGAKPIVADVGARGDRIVAIGDLSDARAGKRLDVSGLSVVPGFVDTHSHGVRGIFRHPLVENYIRQGVTLAVGGPDGSSPLPIGELIAALR